jgi:hypothetical protein
MLLRIDSGSPVVGIKPAYYPEIFLMYSSAATRMTVFFLSHDDHNEETAKSTERESIFEHLLFWSVVGFLKQWGAAERYAECYKTGSQDKEGCDKARGKVPRGSIERDWGRVQSDVDVSADCQCQ